MAETAAEDRETALEIEVRRLFNKWQAQVIATNDQKKRAEEAEAKVQELRADLTALRRDVNAAIAKSALAERNKRRAAKAEVARLRAALQFARALVEKWCHYQGDTKALFDQYLGPIDQALEDQADG